MANRRVAPPELQPKEFSFTAENAEWAKKPKPKVDVKQPQNNMNPADLVVGVLVGRGAVWLMPRLELAATGLYPVASLTTVAITPTPAALILSRTCSRDVSFGPNVTLALGQLGLVAKVLVEVFQEPSCRSSVPMPTTVDNDEKLVEVVVCAVAMASTLISYWPGAALSLTA